ncbi:probable BOI-related E3 ubiquitin-protein ligase 3 isoform X2 [Solanum dulcamara]|uniref:probable BOI-related E3 ubiquitin-protein ligase 3 isoform X2 n=1 Tax=Solanum dulcamara TaxID=45834 RepID=UPI002485E3C6|nr:probable BOI-related E3 ubiquitin-protein ligase 3 isoform X2 [Solanum dulcamara]
MAIQAQLYTDNLGFSSGGSQDLMENACGGFNHVCLTTHQQPNFLQQQQMFTQKIINQNLMNNNITESMPFSQFLATQMEKQRNEIDQFIILQNEKLRWVLNEQKKQQLALIWRKYESKLLFLLKQKDEEIARGANRTKELEEYLKKMEMENQAWQRIVNENEAIVMSLNNTIEQLRESGYCLSTNGEDAESCCDVHDNQDDEEEQETRKMICKSCNSRFSCMIFLPCRHLSSCKPCDSLLHQCPVCGIAKKASIEALI